MAKSYHPKHPKAEHFRKARIFKSLTSFGDLESRIAKLSPELRGDAFEVFAEGYLVTQKQTQAVEVWPDTRIPAKVKKALHLPPKDMGIDGAFKNQSGDYEVYQVKYRTGRPSLNWEELSTFFGLSDFAKSRVLITNCNKLAEVVDERVAFSCIRGNDLDRMEARDFEAIEEWLHSKPQKRILKTPRPHQAVAIDALCDALKEKSRVTATMACGTGKTLVALWLAERMKCQNVLVLVPSLALIRQTLHEWLRETRWNDVSFRCVCSDKQVTRGADELVMTKSDLDFRVNTNSEEVAEFLSRPFHGTRIVFSTYDSAHVVGNAVEGNTVFDLGIFDEAHKTAGRVGKKLSYALLDENIAIKKRIFLTATPRQYDVSRRDKEGDAKVVFSMDIPEMYGSVEHELSFVAAARANIICPYKVVISVVTSEMVNDELLRCGELVVEGDVVRARQVANQLAIKEAVEEHSVQKVFTFHSRVASARSFVADSGEGIGAHLRDFDTFHVNGADRTADREEILKEFAESKRGLISNAKCLTEGVDLPAVDMVAFMSPKKSRVDIVQATGRAMRKDPDNPDKRTGFIMIPLFVEVAAGETREESLDRTGFDEVWNVLEAMQEQDEVLRDIIRQMREERGRVGGFDDSRFREVVEILGPSIEIAELRAAIDTRCIERLGAMWDERYGELIRFKEQHGHCNVPRHWPENSKLAYWIKNQRTLYTRRQLREDRLKCLETIGFLWDPINALWEERFAELEEYKAKHGACLVSQKDNHKLNTWITEQRKQAKTGRLSEDRKERLEAMGFVWDPINVAWEEKFSELEQYKAKHGDCNVPRRDNPKLKSWIALQRKQKKQGQLSEYRIERLEAIGFEWVATDPWEEKFTELKKYKSAYGDCNVPAAWPENKKLAGWIQTQRSFKVQRRIQKDRIERLDAISFIWDPDSAIWEERFAQLQDYKTQHGNYLVPNNWPENRKLAAWTNNLRALKREGRLSDEKIERLDAIGFNWDKVSVVSAIWEKRFAELQEYKAKHGDCLVPHKWSENRKLAIWVHNLRGLRSQGRLSDEQIKRLEAIGFEWSPYDAIWNNMFSALQKYKSEHGDCNVPKNFPDDPKFGAWVASQRNFKRQGTISEDRITLLDSIGFVWDLRLVIWEANFSALVKYKEECGDCRVKYKHRSRYQVPNLYSWMISQRRNFESGKLSETQISKLESIGFEWSTQAAKAKQES